LQRLLHVAREFFHSQVAHGNAEIISRNVFEFMSLIKDDGSGFRQNPGIGSTVSLHLDGEIGEEEVVVDDDDVAFGCPLVHSREEAALEGGAFLPRTEI
jgi:hypothetical protein